MGFVEAELISLQQTNDSTHIAKYFFGRKHQQIKIFYNKNTFRKKDLQKISKNSTNEYFMLPFEKIESALIKLNNIQTQNGNAFARLGLKKIQLGKNNILEAELNTDYGNKRTIDTVIIKGYENFPRSFVKHYAGIKIGQSFIKPDIIKKNSSIDNLGFADAEKSPEVLFRKNKTEVYLYIIKKNFNLFDGVLGFSTNDKTQKLNFNGYLDLELNNNLNFGEQLSINYKADGNDQRNFKIKTKLPYLFNTPFGVGAELKIFKRDSTFATTDQQIRATYQIYPSLDTYLGYKGYESTNLLDVNNTSINVLDYKSRFVSAGFSFSKLQNNFLFPFGTLINVETEIGKRESENSNNDQLRISMEAQQIFNLTPTQSIYIKNGTSILFGEDYFTNELFRFGGINSMRGFEENSIDANFFSAVNTEYRYQPGNNLYLHSILDLAYFENQLQDTQEKLLSLGIGIGLQTEAGIFNFSVANGFNESTTFDISNTKIHISVRSKF